eukprot:5340273-Pyramimonas_sp.AAC.1
MTCTQGAHRCTYLEALRHLRAGDLRVETGEGHAAVSDQLWHDALHGVNRDGKPDPGVEAAPREDGRVHTNHLRVGGILYLALGVEEGPAGVARVDGRVCLDAARDHAARLALDLTVQAGHHPCNSTIRRPVTTHPMRIWHATRRRIGFTCCYI